MDSDSLMTDDAWLETRKSLLSRVKDLEDDRSWRVFFDLYWKLIHNIAAKSGLQRSECEEVVQEVFLDLARRLPEFKYDTGRGSFKTWLRTLVEWRIKDQFRKRVDHHSLEDLKGLDWPNPEKPSDMTSVWEEEWKRNLFDAALCNVRSSIDPKLFQVFDLMANRGLPATEVAKILHVSSTWVYMAKHRVHLKLKQQIRQLRTKYEKELSTRQKESF